MTNPYEEFQRQRMEQLVRQSTPSLTAGEDNTPWLVEADRCDSCGARAYVSATFKGTDLLFCAHHFNESEARIRELAEHIIDERHVLATAEARNRHQGEN